MSDIYNLERFVDAQNAGGTWDRAVAELRRGRKTSHWMWYVLPQIAGLGQSAMSRTYALSGLGEARAYLCHPVLGPRLLQTATTTAEAPGASAVDIFGTVDAQKLRSSMTLFAHAAPDEPVFTRVLDRFFDGVRDSATERQLRTGDNAGTTAAAEPGG